MSEVSHLSNVFISYSRKDSAFVRQIDAAFKARKLEVWIDWEDIPLSVNWWDEIKAGIEASDVFVFVISPDSVTSDVCRRELEHGLEHNKRLIPVLYRDVSTPELREKIHESLTAHNWVIFRETEDFEQAIDRLIETVNADFDHLRYHTRLLVRGRDWQSRQGDDSILLVGSELREAQAWLLNSINKHPQPTDLHTQFIRASADAYVRRRRIFSVAGLVMAIFLVLSVALYFALGTATTNLTLAQERGTQVANENATNVALAIENRRLADNTSLVSHSVITAREILTLGDSFRAIPYLLRAMAVLPLPSAEITLANVAYNAGAQYWLTGHSDNAIIYDSASSPIDRIALTAGQDRKVILWNLETGEQIRTYEGHAEAVRSVAFAPNGQTFASAGSDGQVYVWELESGESRQLIDMEYRALEVTYSPDGGLLATVFWDTNRTDTTDDDSYEIRIWTVNTWEEIVQVRGVRATMDSLVFTPNNAAIVVGMGDGKINVWSLDALRDVTEFPQPTRVINGHRQAVNELTFSANGRQLLSASSDNSVRLWDYGTGTVIRVFDYHTDFVLGADFIPNTTQIISASRDRNVIIWDTDTGLPLRIMTGHSALPSTVTVSFDGSRALTGSNNGLGIIWDLVSSQLHHDYVAHTRIIRDLAVHPDGQRLVTASSGGTLILWDIASGTRLWESEAQAPASITALGFAKGGSTIVTVGSDRVVRQWSTENGAQIGEGLTGHTSSVYALAVSPDGRYVLTGSQDATAILWDLEENQLVRRIERLNGTTRILTVAFHPDGVTGFASSNNVLVRFNLADGSIVQRYVGHTESIVGLDVSVDGTLMVASDFRRRVLLWDVASSNLLEVLERHRSPIWGVAISADNRWIASASDDGSVVVWDVASTQAIREFTGFPSIIRNVTFTPDGEYVIFGENHLHIMEMLEQDELIAWVEANRLREYPTCAQQGLYIIEPLCETLGDPVSATIGANRGEMYLDRPQIWTYNGQVGQVLTIRVNADAPGTGHPGTERKVALGLLDTTVQIIAPDGTVIGVNDDDDTINAPTTDSALYQVRLPVDGIYQIIVGSFNNGTLGRYTLLIEANDG